MSIKVRTNFYLSRILNNKVFCDNKSIGRLLDIGIDINSNIPNIIIAKIKMNKGIKYLSWKSFNVRKISGQYQLNVKKIEYVEPDKNIYFLVKNILDKQIIDINGRKVVRVNDIRLTQTDNELLVIAVDIGIEGILRRLAIAKPLKKFLKIFNINISSKLILWRDIAALIQSNENIMLSTTYEKLSTLRPSDLADIIENIDSKTGIAIFSSLDDARAADVLEELEKESQINILKTLSKQKVADILEEMPADEVADVLDDLNKDMVEELLNKMEKDVSSEVRELMEYPDNTVGSLMTTDFIDFKESDTVEQTINRLRELKPESDVIYYLYVVDSKDKLTGVVSLRDLVISEPDTKLSEIMDNKPIYVKDMDSIESLIKIETKYNLMAVPVVDDNMVLRGTVIITDIIYELLKNRRLKA
jgi:CBS domain-containing protein